MEKISVLHFVSGLDSGGVSILLREWYIRRNNIVDIDIATITKGIVYDELTTMGCKIYEFKPISEIGFLKYTIEAYKILKKGNYDIVHSHVGFLSAFIFIAAILANVRIRILHAHTTRYNKDNGKIINTFIIFLLRKISVMFATEYCSCSKSAAEYLFGKKIANTKGIIINNGIDLKKFCYKSKKNNDRKTIGYVARFEKVKNHKFLIEVMRKLCKIFPNIQLLLIGNGDYSTIYKRVKEYSLENNVIFMHAQQKIEKYYSKMDVFVFPSLNEGLGIVAIEAQASGIPTIVSFGVPNEVLITPIAVQIDLDVDKWVAQIIEFLNNKNCYDVHKYIINKGYDIDYCVKKLMNFYLNCKRN